MVGGELTIRAAYTPSQPQRVDITFMDAALVSGEPWPCKPSNG